IFTRTHRVSLFSFQGTCYYAFALHRVSAATLLSYYISSGITSVFFKNFFTPFEIDTALPFLTASNNLSQYKQ
ncbi:hypothetical protein, partial [Aneurinibacillus sp. REN35]|uniref:hypothetical protein n=1 Tax=Aneurinibacillus sp. REN35 TaxID=3237286 RepID=UPI0035273901